ncbi:hypothetical protein BGZ98_003068 [Dissophora globulifera]|nr:hypothetical protein BGZ98_003068 [Dissophora globulifera]
MPSRRRKRVSHQSTLTLATATTTNHASVSSRPDILQDRILQGCCNVGDTVEAKLSETVSCAPNSRAYLNLNSAPLPVSESSSASLAVTGSSTTKVTFAKNHTNRPDRYATNQATTSRAFLTASATTLQQSSTRRASGIFMDRCATPTRSLTNASLNSINSGISNNSSVFSTAMPLADSSMSIQSQFSEVSSMLSAAMTASGLPTMMDAMHNWLKMRT